MFLCVLMVGIWSHWSTQFQIDVVNTRNPSQTTLPPPHRTHLAHFCRKSTSTRPQTRQRLPQLPHSRAHIFEIQRRNRPFGVFLRRQHTLIVGAVICRTPNTRHARLRDWWRWGRREDRLARWWGLRRRRGRTLEVIVELRRVDRWRWRWALCLRLVV